MANKEDGDVTAKLRPTNPEPDEDGEGDVGHDADVGLDGGQGMTPAELLDGWVIKSRAALPARTGLFMGGDRLATLLIKGNSPAYFVPQYRAE